jgi:hypothetical protein
MAKIISIGKDTFQATEDVGVVDENVYEPDYFLEQMKGKFKKLVIVGIDHEDSPVISASINLIETNFLLSVAQTLLINNSLGEFYEE